MTRLCAMCRSPVGTAGALSGYPAVTFLGDELWAGAAGAAVLDAVLSGRRGESAQR